MIQQDWSECINAGSNYTGIGGYDTYPRIIGDWKVRREGRLEGVPYIGGIGPTLGMKGGSFFIKGIGYVNKLNFHHFIKRDILKAVGELKYSKVVGENPDIIIERGEIILKGTGRFTNKVLKTGLKTVDFFK